MRYIIAFTLTFILALSFLSPGSTISYAAAPKPTSVLAVPTTQPGLYTSLQGGFRMTAPKKWTATSGMDPSSGVFYDAFMASSSRIIVIFDIGNAVDEKAIVASLNKSGHKITRLGHTEVIGKTQSVYGYHDIAGDQPPYQIYAAVYIPMKSGSLWAVLASDPAHFKKDVAVFLSALDTMQTIDPID